MARILIVDDEPVVRDFLEKYLQKLGYDVVTAGDGEEAYGIFLDEGIDLILTDISMPKMNGYDLCRKIKASTEDRYVPVLLLTALTDRESIAEAYRCGADHYLVKPIILEEVLATIGNVLKIEDLTERLRKENEKSREDLLMARRIQQGLLPKRLPKSERYDLHVEYIPAEKVGGDFYDIIERRGVLEIFLSDVCGHGVSAALLTVAVKSALETRPYWYEPVSETLRMMNRTIGHITQPDMFVTAFLTKVRVDDLAMSYSVAGHPHPLLFRPSAGVVTSLGSPPALPLAAMEHVTYESVGMTLQSGDVLLFYTDGLSESRDRAGEFFGDGPLANVLKRAVSESADRMAQAILEELKCFRGGRDADDDITFVVLKIR
jgi:sigma-B regulation protein RsbU (phosphoserine phosphatase)